MPQTPNLVSEMRSTHQFRNLFFVIGVLSLITQAGCFSEPRIYTASIELTEDGDVIQKPRLVRASELRAQESAPGPIAEVDHTAHDFGRLAPLTTHQHVFVIRNRGDAPLKLTEGPTTCKCTVANLIQGTVPAGGKAPVAMQWNTGRDSEYSHSATIYTNDPRQPIVQLKIMGQVQVLLRCEPDELVFSRVAPGERPSATTLVYSQVWDKFHLTVVDSGHPGVEHNIEEASEEERQALGATTAYRVTFTLPSDLAAGYFTIPVNFRAVREADQPNSEELTPAHADCELMLTGKVLRRLSVYGPDVDVRGTILMGRVTEGRGAYVKLLLKLRDDDKDLRVTKIDTLPKSLNVRVERYETSGGKDHGLYHLHVELPKDAPTFRLPPDKRGRVTVEFDHPRVPRLDLPVDLIVAPRSDYVP